MSIDSGIPDLEHQASESDKDFEEIEVEDKSKSCLLYTSDAADE